MEEEAHTVYRSDERLERARHLMDLGRPGQAVPLAASVLQDDPEDAEALGVMACALLCSGHYYDAITCAQKAAAANPYDEYPHRLIAFAHLNLGNKKEALAAAQEAVRLEPEESGALWALFRALALNRRWKEALEAGEVLTELFPEEGDSHQARSEAHYGLRQWTQAEQAARDGLGVQPEMPDLHIALARALWAQKRRAESLLAYRSAVLADPGDSDAADALGEQVGRYIIPIEQAAPWYLWVCVTTFFCWYAHKLLGWWTWWGLLWAILILGWNTLCVCSTDYWIVRRTRKRYVEMPPEVLRHLWLANAFHLSLPLVGTVLLMGGSTILLLLFWTIFPGRGPAVPEGWGAAAFFYLIGLGVSVFSSMVRMGNLEEQLLPLKPAELTEPAPPKEEPRADWVRHIRPMAITPDLFDLSEDDPA